MKIQLHRHPFAGASPEEYEAQSVAAWLLDHYAQRPRVSVQVYVGEPSAETDITRDTAAMLRGDAPVYVVLESPGGPVLPYLINLAISMVISAAITMLFAKDKPLVNRDQESPNNQLTNRQNQVRTMQRIEDIYGTVRSIPSLMMQTYAKYVSHQKVEYGYYCAGRGYHVISDVRESDTPLEQIRGASAAVYAPFTSPNSGDAPQLQVGDPIIDAIVTVAHSSSVDGIVLKAANQLQLKSPSDYIFYGPGPGSGLIPATTGDLIFQTTADRKPNFAAVCQVGQALTISMADTAQERVSAGATISVDAGSSTYTSTITGFFRGLVNGSTVTVSGGFTEATNTGAKTVVSHTGETMTVAETLITESPVSGGIFAMVINYSSVRTIASVESGYVTLTGGGQFLPGGLTGELGAENYTANLSVANGLVDWTDWFTLPNTDRTEVWTNVVAFSGMYKDDGAKSGATVAYEVQIEQLTALLAPTGTVETVTGSISGATSNLRAETLERVTGWVGPARVRVRRTTPYDYDFNGGVVDEIQWADLYGVSPVSKTDFGNVTTIHTVTQSTAQATGLQNRQLNCLAARQLPTYNGTTFSGVFDSTGRLVSGTIAATSRIVDILAAVTVDPKIGRRTISELDMAQIWATQQALDAWNASCGQFNYTFDSDQISFEETVNTIAGAAFCVAYRQNGVIRLALDRPQAASTALFTHRNKKPKSETITRQFASDSEYDGVELVYQDPDTESSETIRLPLDGSYTKLKKVEVPGIRNYVQAWLRANREYYRLRAQRMNIETVTTTDARALLPNARVDIVDNTRVKSYDGEVVGQSGLTLTLSREVTFLPATAHSIVLMKRDGSLQSITCTAGPDANQVVLTTAPAEAIVTTETPDAGIRTIFSFAADSRRGLETWLVQEIGTSDGKYVRLRAINYSDEYYTADSAAIPDKSGVIN